jgi:hypothetical protein
MQDPIQKISKTKRAGMWLKWKSTAYQTRPEVQILVPQKNKKETHNIFYYINICDDM